jgi:hypothetical protein
MLSFDPNDIVVEGDRHTNCVTFTLEGVGIVTIFNIDRDSCNGGPFEYPEVDFDSEEKSLGAGSASDIYSAIRLANEAMALYALSFGNSNFCYHSDDRDGGGSRRERLFKKLYPKLINLGLFK